MSNRSARHQPRRVQMNRMMPKLARKVAMYRSKRRTALKNEHIEAEEKKQLEDLLKTFDRKSPTTTDRRTPDGSRPRC